MALRVMALCIFLLSAVQAESLPDPTRPALGWNADAPDEIAPSGPRLQAIRSQGGVRSALIDGQNVRIGSKVNDVFVTRIDEDRVWLRGPNGVQQLKLFPEVEKRSAPQTSRKRVRKEAE